MKRPGLLFIFILLLYTSSQAQPWFLYNRQQKDSIIFHHFDKGNRYAGLNLGGTFLAGAWSGGAIKLEPVFGYMIRDRQLVAVSILYEQASVKVDTDYIKSSQICIGGNYRYYLPERKVLSPIFGQISLYGGYFSGEYDFDSGEDADQFFILNLNVGAGISFPINKFNLELGLYHIYRLVNVKLLDEHLAGGTGGYLTFSYCF